MKHTTKMKQAKLTTRKVVYSTDDPAAPIETVYVAKSEFKDKAPPAEIQVTLEYELDKKGK